MVDMMVEPSATLSPPLQTVDKLVCDIYLNHIRFSKVNSCLGIIKYCENSILLVKQKKYVKEDDNTHLRYRNQDTSSCRTASPPSCICLISN